MQYYTNIEQSKKLLELGLSPESSDMHYSITGWNGKNEPFYAASDGKLDYYTRGIPCWSVVALLNIIPKEINISYNIEEFPESDNCPPRVCHPFLEVYNNTWCGGFVDNAGSHDPMFKSNDILEIIYKTVCWLLENINKWG